MSETTTELHNYKDTAAAVVEEVFSTMLGTEVTPFESSEVRELSHPVVGTVYFAGNWKGAVLLECERPALICPDGTIDVDQGNRIHWTTMSATRWAKSRT